ncbi:hypothetical protein [Streptococcus saliviloxodontae]|uniref:Membrane protein n=1 Tax=Streptococcus saliviloxodontae TaxID=1349416 RepID=A0ABS2PKF4_9STRE|nr:hypothetical protein [Streptococcus saliviloxodontae]MBM7635293.1 putative membrane protein [Streptococcus saliviloxodontae]
MIPKTKAKLKKHLTTTSILTLILNLLISLIALLNIIGLVYIATQSDAQLAQIYDHSTLSTIREAQTFWTYFQAICVLVLYILTSLFLAINLRRLKTDKSISFLPYYLGFLLTVVTTALVIYSILSGQSTPHISNFVAPVLFTALYSYGYQCSKAYLKS